RCARNCFQCPVCLNTLAVNASTCQVNTGPYLLVCNVCRWNSQEIGMLFERPTGLALQLLKNEDDSPDTQEFDGLKAHFEKQLRANTPPLSSSLLSFSSSFRGKISDIRLGGGTSKLSYHMHQPPELEDITAYKHCAQVPDTDSTTWDLLAGLHSMDIISTMAQRRTQLYDQPYQLNQLHPQRTHLSIKRSKRCRTCRHILIKPEPKAQTTRFKIKLVAMNYIPTITIASLCTLPSLQLQLGVPTQFALKFTNPLYEELTVSLATP
ncbi:dynactin p62 family-domain-containing protein, partial [Chlamydoabsidia padenii]